MAVPLETLQSLASTFSAVRQGPQQVLPGQPVKFSLLPSAIDLRATDLLDAPLSLTWISKNVRFENHTIESALGAEPFDPAAIDAVLAGGMPARVPVVGNIVGTQELTGVPGEIAQLAGSFPVAVEVPVGVGVTWEVLDSTGTVVLDPGPSTFTAPNGTITPEVTFIFAPQTVELTNTLTIPVTQRFIRARVELTAGSTTHSFFLPTIPVDIPAIPVPTVIVYFLHTNFAATSGDDDGASFIVVPNNSPLKSAAELQATLNTLESTLSGLTSVASLAAFLLGVSELVSALSAQPHVQFRVTNSANNIDNFNNVTLIQRGIFSNDTEAEDELSSLIYIGPTERRRVRCFNRRNRNGGRFTLTAGPELHVMIRNLHTSTPVAEPNAGSIVIDVASDNFGDRLSSMSFL